MGTPPSARVAVARAIDERAPAHRDPPRLGLEQDRVDPPVVGLAGADGEGVEQELHAVGHEHRIGGALERRHVVRLRVDLAEDEMRLVEAVERAHAVEQVVGNAVHDLPDVAEDVGVQAAEVGDAGRSAHAAEKAVALDQENACAVACRRRGRGNAGRTAAQHHDVERAEDGRVAGGLADRRHDGWLRLGSILRRGSHRRGLARDIIVPSLLADGDAMTTIDPKLRKALAGISGILVTPFDAADKIAPARLKPIVDRAVAAGVHILVANGNTGEFYGLTTAEAEAMVHAVAEQIPDAFRSSAASAAASAMRAHWHGPRARPARKR